MNTIGNLQQEAELPQLLQEFQQVDGNSRFIAISKLQTRANELGMFADTLLSISSNQNSPVRYTATWLLHELADRTARLWKDELSEILCPTCFVRGGVRSIKLANAAKPLKFYGCRSCGQSREFLHNINHIVADLDNRIATRYDRFDQSIYVNWLHHRSLFDFDEVQISHATDEDSERLAIQIGNDTDPTRKPKYKRMRCTVSPKCELSKNTIRILHRTFGRVEALPD